MRKNILEALLVFALLLSGLTTLCYAEGPTIVSATQLVWFIGSFIGTIARLLLPIARKSNQIETDGWSHKYTGTTILAVILAIIISGVALPTAQIPQQFDTLFSLFWLAFVAGFGENSALIELSEYVFPKPKQ